MVMRFIIGFLALIAVWIGQAFADNGSWFSSLMMPDRPTIACCGPADAYYADRDFVKDGKFYVEVTGKPRESNPVAIGTIVEIPSHKFNRDANILGRPIVFLNPEGYVYCYIGSAGV